MGCRAKWHIIFQGCIINVSSLLAEHGGRGASVYAAAKAGVVGMDSHQPLS